MSIIDMVKAKTKELQSKITSKKALKMLKDGNKRFLKNMSLNRIHLENVKQTKKGQYPTAVILSCIDSRVPVEIIFDQGIGDLFNVKVAGNIVNEDVLGSIEYACKFVNVKLVVVLGHTSCGAVKGACDNLKAGNLTVLLDKIKPVIKKTPTNKNEQRNSKNTNFVNAVALNNVMHVKDEILLKSEILKELNNNSSIEIVTAMYDVSTGKVDFIKK